MNTTNLLAWLLCLILAFFASVLAMLNRYEVILVRRAQQRLEQQVQTISSPADQVEVWKDIRDLLERIDTRLQEGQQHPASSPSN